MTSTFTAAIRARDFDTSTVVDRRDEWTGGKMRALIAALDGTPVVITTDKATGHCEIGARIVEVAVKARGAYSVDSIVIERDLSDGGTQRTACRLSDIGDTVVPLAAPKAKWDALENYRTIEHAVRVALADTGRAPNVPGTWDVTIFVKFANAQYRPYGQHTWKDRPLVKVERRDWQAVEDAERAAVAIQA
jgi:hypothetical protein